MKKSICYPVFFFIFLLCTGKAAAQHESIDSLINVVNTTQNDTLKIQTLNTLSLDLVDAADYVGALKYARQLLQVSAQVEKSPNRAIAIVGKKGKGQFWNCIGQVNLSQSKLNAALNYYFIALPIFKATGDSNAVAEVYSNIASTYADQGDYGQSLDYYMKSLKIDEEAKSLSPMAIDYGNIAAVLTDSKNKPAAAYYLFKAIAIQEKLNEKSGLAVNINNLASIYQTRGDSAKGKSNENTPFVKQQYELANTYYLKSLRLHQECGDKEGSAVSLENLGVICSELGKPDEALEYLQKSLDLYIAFNAKAEMSYCLNNIGKVYQKQHKMAEAEKYFKEGLANAKETGSNDFIMKSNDFLSNFYEETNRPTEALKYYKNYMAYHDSVFNQESTRKLVSTELNYNFEKAQAANKAEHEKEIIVLEGENKIQKQLRLFLFLVIAFCVVILVFVQRAYRNKKRLATFLGNEDSRKELLLQEVHHRINNNLQIISSLLSLQANSAEDERLNVYLKQSQNRIQSLSALHELLYQNNSSLQVNMQEYIEKVLDFHKEVASTLPAKVTIETEVESVMFPTKIAVPLALIINELVTNSLKYAFTEKVAGKIEIRLAATEKNTDWKLMVADNGKGMGPVEERRKGSLGLRLVNIMVKQIGGRLKVNEGEGASFEVAFTVQKQKTI
ncbi:MAG: hypothetical protein JWP12_596 [Bacteroidetes bacterium]|nr:hypothetical protein [Bacteroidota bacterium]